MINFDHYIEFYKKFEDVLSKMKEDGDIFNTKSFGSFEELLNKWLKANKAEPASDDLRILSTYLICNILKPVDYLKELRFLHEEIRLRNMVEKYLIVNPLIDMMSYASHYALGDPKKGFADENFLKGLINSIGKELTPESFQTIYPNLKVKNYKDPELKKFLDNLKGQTELL